MPRRVRCSLFPALGTTLFLIGWVICLFARPAAAGEKTSLQLSDVYRQESITDFKVSPLGDEAVYVRSWYDHAQPGRRSAIWRIDGATGRAEPLEPGEPDGRLPTYSPDGRWLAFVSSRPYRDWKLATVPPFSEPTGLFGESREVNVAATVRMSPLQNWFPGARKC